MPRHRHPSQFTTVLNWKSARIGRSRAYTIARIMGFYRVVAVQNTAGGGVEAIISGPGISASGVRYWFGGEDEAYSFAENLNLSHSEAKRLAAARKSRLQKRVAEVPLNRVHAAAAN